jgi:Ca2+/Na+ antiporter
MLRFGPLEFALVAGVVIIIILITLVARSRNPKVKNRESTGKTTKQESRYYLKRAGFILIVIGAVLFFIWMGLLRWAIWAAAWSFVIIIAGVVLYFIAGRKR